MNCHQLIYVSQPTIEFVDEALLDILKIAQIENHKQRISGLMVYHNGKFMQLLEGDEINVKNLFAKIQRDTRHTDIKVLLERDSAKRCFSTWAMGFGMSGCSNGFLSGQPFYFSLDDIRDICEALKCDVGEAFLKFLNV